MTISLSDRVKVPDDVLISKLQDESVILNLDSERYYGIDSVGTHCAFAESQAQCLSRR